jgi:uncharacterized protein
MEYLIHTARFLVAAPIRLYQSLVSPYLGTCCRFYPSCSRYAVQAIYYYGVIKGTGFAIKRIFRCHPWSAGGYDPVSSMHSELNKLNNLKNKR